MLLPVKWLDDYIEINEDIRILADKLTLSGSHVESIISIDEEIENVVVGKILKIEKHINADKLIVCEVDVGKEVLTIVTGAKNVKEGDYIPVAMVGSKLPGNILIEKTDFRGIDSFGMLCSLNELGYSDNVISKEQKEGILILDKEYPLGTSLVEALELNYKIIELEVTPNRPDCLSIIGMARETGAAFNRKIKEPEINIEKEVENINDYIDSVEVQSENCNRYYTRVIKDIKIGESPLWIQTRLMESGMRPINNIVDITNYVMLEYGSPLHAFDLDKIEEKRILVRQAKKDEKITTLDNKERKLDENKLVITDGKNPIAIAGVMGGIDTEVTQETNLVLLESANFNSKSIRLTSKDLNLRSEASNRFEKGIDPNLCQVAADRVCQLIEETGSGTIVKGKIDVYKDKVEEKYIKLRPARANKILGIEISTDEMIAYLNALNLESKLIDGKIETKIPTYRLDLEIEVDLIEEIGRLYGFHNIASKPLVGALTRGEKPKGREIEDITKNVLQGLGLNQVMSYSFISPKAYDKINLPAESPLRDYIKLMNPLGEDYSVMRTTLITNMLDLLSRNYNRGVEESYLYEIGNIFLAKDFPVTEIPDEKKVLCLGACGHKDFYYMKEVIDKLLNRLGIDNVEYVREKDNPSFHPGRTAKLMKNNEELGIIGEIHIDVAENYNIKERVYIGQLDFSEISKLAKIENKYKELPKYPAMFRDLALVVEDNILVGEIEKVISKHGEGLIENIELFDIYTGDQIEEGMKSVAYSIRYRSYEGTLKEKQVNDIQKAIIKDLEKTFGAELRT